MVYSYEVEFIDKSGHKACKRFNDLRSASSFAARAAEGDGVHPAGSVIIWEQVYRNAKALKRRDSEEMNLIWHGVFYEPNTLNALISGDKEHDASFKYGDKSMMFSEYYSICKERDKEKNADG